MWIKAYVLRIDPKKWNERVLRLLMLFHIAHRGQLWLSVLLPVYLFAWNKFTPSRFWAIWTFKSIGWAWRFDHIPTNWGLSREKKKNFSRKNFLSENSWFSLWILFPRGWLFQHRARRHYSPGPNFPTQGKAKRSLLRAQGVEKQRFPCRTQAISCTEWIFCSVCWAEIKEHAGDLTALSSSSTNVLLQDLKTVLKDLLSFPKRIVSPQLVGGWLLRWGRSQKDK